MGSLTTLRPSKAAWFAAAVLALLAFGCLAFPEMARFPESSFAGAAWAVAHWGCPPPLEYGPVVSCGVSRGFPPVP